MIKFDRKKLKKNIILQRLASLNITVVSLILLFILTLWGTIAQVSNGLYLAQERYFYSMYFLVAGFIPFPGAQLVMWILFFNLVSVMLIRFVYSWKNTGILIIHIGLMLFLVSGYITFQCAKDSHLTLNEGEASNVSTAFHLWELAIWDPSKDQESSNKFTRDIVAVDVDNLKIDTPVNFDELGFTLELEKYFRNAAAYSIGEETSKYINSSGIGKIEKLNPEIEPEKNNPGLILKVTTDQNETVHLILYGRENTPTQIQTSRGTFNFIARLKRYPLPFTLKLIDFVKEEHPGTSTARSFKSRVAIDVNGVWREKLISMNEPLRYKNYTFYQSSFSVDELQNEKSTLAVVKNAGRVMPYIATFVTFAGLVIHFGMVAFQSKRNKIKRKEDEET